MTNEEALEVVKVIETADGQCTHCARNLADELQKKFPEFDWRSMLEEYLKEMWS